MKKQFPLPIVSIFIAVALLLGTQINSVFSGDNIFDQPTSSRTSSRWPKILRRRRRYKEDGGIGDRRDAPGPRSAFGLHIPAKDIPKIIEDFKGSFEGIGVEFEVRNDTLRVVTPCRGPSSLGILAGDKIIRIDDSSAIGITQRRSPKTTRPQGHPRPGGHLQDRREESHRFQHRPGQDPVAHRRCRTDGRARHRLYQREPFRPDHRDGIQRSARSSGRKG